MIWNCNRKLTAIYLLSNFTNLVRECENLALQLFLHLKALNGTEAQRKSMRISLHPTKAKTYRLAEKEVSIRSISRMKGEYLKGRKLQKINCCYTRFEQINLCRLYIYMCVYMERDRERNIAFVKITSRRLSQWRHSRCFFFIFYLRMLWDHTASRHSSKIHGRHLT
jgi:hypothetical protein